MKHKLTLADVRDDLRGRGIAMSIRAIANEIEAGRMPGTVVNTGRTGRRTFLIYRADYEPWAIKHTGG